MKARLTDSTLLPLVAIALYLPVLILTAFSAAGHPFRLRLCAGLFLLSDIR
ncbi:MAG: hypothetical protein IJ088_01830 [Clostridia bacterium]|nr:hypothetical protein [Clostridia bacterium]